MRPHPRARPVYVDETDTLLLISSSSGSISLSVTIPVSESPGVHYITAIGRQGGNAQVAFAVNVNAACPGFLATAMVRAFLEDPEAKAGLEALCPWPRVGDVKYVSKCVLFLASDDADWVTGSMLTVDGGFTAR